MSFVVSQYSDGIQICYFDFRFILYFINQQRELYVHFHKSSANPPARIKTPVGKFTIFFLAELNKV